MPRPLSPTITTPRLRLTPLRPDDAAELHALLDDERLHTFIGGRPLGLAELRTRYAELAAGSPDAREEWLNWIVRLREGAAIGTVQATIATREERRTAHIAWVVGTAWQTRGYASEAARALVDWLGRRGIDEIRAHIHPEHRASERVAARAGLERTDDVADGERVWRRSLRG